MMCNNTTHEPLELYLPDYTVAETERGDFCEGQTFQTEVQRTHWHVNMAAMLKLGEWFDFMRRNGVWDNTRIIIASDHGKTMDRETEGLGFFDYMIMDDPDIDVEIVNPLLLVKDFGGLQLRTADDFMTIADVPFFAMDGIIEKPVNPFTNRLMDNGAKMSGPQLVTSSHKASPSKQADRTTFDTSDGHWFSVHDDIFDERNWGLVE